MTAPPWESFDLVATLAPAGVGRWRAEGLDLAERTGLALWIVGNGPAVELAAPVTAVLELDDGAATLDVLAGRGLELGAPLVVGADREACIFVRLPDQVAAHVRAIALEAAAVAGGVASVFLVDYQES